MCYPGAWGEAVFSMIIKQDSPEHLCRKEKTAKFSDIPENCVPRKCLNACLSPFLSKALGRWAKGWE